MNKTILSYIFIALSIIFLFWSIFKTEETRKNNHKDTKIIILHFIDLVLIIINMVVIGNVLLSKQSTTSSVMPIYMIHMAGSSIKDFGLMIAIAIPLIIICYPLWKKISKKLRSSGLSIINIFEMIILSYVIYKILTRLMYMDDETKKYILFVIVLLFIDQIWKINSFWGLIITITIILLSVLFALFYNFMECSNLLFPIKILITFIIFKIIIHYVINIFIGYIK